ncbi:hypothetical protein AeNC1_019042 [Aphanomyces euteiches]|nr:hypothetical protein AeNC1_019042 [Aphanomyces euteiches]
MRVLVPLALATSAVVALNLRGQDSPLVFANQVAPMDAPEDLRLLINEFGGYPDSPRRSAHTNPKPARGPKERAYRKKGGQWGKVTGAVALGTAGAAAGSLGGPLGGIGGAAGGILAGGAAGKGIGKAIGGAYGRRQDKKDQRKALKRSATIA